MKNILVLIIISISYLACFEDSTIEANSFKDLSTDLRNNSKSSMAKSVFNHDFKRDFKVKSSSAKFEASSDVLNAIITSSNTGAMGGNYSDIKSKLNIWSPNIDEKSSAVQNISLRYLRDYFLQRSDESSINETSFLFKILIQHKSVDLDVLGDAYIKLLPTFSNEEQIQYYNYIETLHDEEVKYVAQKFDEYKNGYLNSDEQDTKNKLLMYGKDLERRSKACKYVRDITGIDLE